MLENQMPLWNIINLPAPNGDFSSYCVNDAKFHENISNLVSCLTRAGLKIANKHDEVWNEVMICLQLQRAAALKLPCDKFLHILNMVSRCLKHFVILKLSQSFFDLNQSFLTGLSTKKNDTASLPSQQQLEYLLIRMQGAAKLILKTIEYIEETYVHLIQRMKIGHQVRILLMACTTAGRIRFSSLLLLRLICNFYQEIKSYHNILKKGSWQWPIDPELPENLWKWLNPSNFEKNYSENDKPHKFSDAFFKHTNTLKNNNDNEIITIDDDDIVIKTEPEDIGEVQPRNINHSSNNSVHVSHSDTGEIQPESSSSGTIRHDTNVEKNELKPGSSNASYQTDDEEQEAEHLSSDNNEELKKANDLSIFLEIVKNAKSINEILKLLKPFKNMKNNAELRKTYRLKLSEAKKLKPLYYKLKTKNVENELSKKPILAKKRQKRILRMFKSQIIIIFDRKSPIKSLKSFEKLFCELVENLKYNSKYNELLSNIYKKCKSDFDLLKKNGQDHYAQRLIYTTSRRLINKYKESVLSETF